MGKVVDRAIEATAAVDQIVAAHSLEVFGGSRRIVAAVENVVKIRAANAVDAGETIGAGRVVACGNSGGTATGIEGGIPAIAVERHVDAGRGVQIGNSRRTITGDLIVAAASLEFVEQAGSVGRDGAAG